VQRDNCPDCEGTGQRIDFAAIRAGKLDARGLFEAVKAAGIAYDNHESDLYIEATPEARALLRRYEHRDNARPFVHAVTGAIWLDVPFAFVPWWDARAAQ
jgi:hypothetical protein